VNDDDKFGAFLAGYLVGGSGSRPTKEPPLSDDIACAVLFILVLFWLAQCSSGVPKTVTAPDARKTASPKIHHTFHPTR